VFFTAGYLAPLAWTQTAPPAPTTAPVIKARGPEAVAAQDPNRVVAVVDGKQITASQALQMLKPFPPEERKQYEANLSNLVLQVYIRQQMAESAKKLNLEQQSPWKEQIDFARDNVLTKAYLAQMSANAGKAAASEDPQKYYDTHPGDFDSVQLSGIFVSFSPPGTPASAAAVVRTEAQARDKADELEKKLKAGGDFAALARTDSDNQNSGAKGGDLGTFNTGDPQIPATIKNAVVKLQPGQYSEPVQIPNGFLIVKLDKRTKLNFEQARPGIVQRLESERSQAAVKQELDKYKITVQDADFFNAPGAAVSHVPSLQRPGTPAAAPQTQPKP
jgi:peptidyl-prolyl cis-trans isomerase C